MTAHKAATLFEELRDAFNRDTRTFTDVLEQAFEAGKLAAANLHPDSQKAAVHRIAKKRARIEQAHWDRDLLADHTEGSGITIGDFRRALADAYAAGAQDAGRAMAAREQAVADKQTQAYERGEKHAIRDMCAAFRDWASDHGVELVPLEDAPEPCREGHCVSPECEG